MCKANNNLPTAQRFGCCLHIKSVSSQWTVFNTELTTDKSAENDYLQSAQP